MFKWRKKTKWKLANLSSSGKYHLKLHLFLRICCWNIKLIKFPRNNSSFIVDLYVMFSCLEMLLSLTVPFTVLTLLVG